MQTRTLKFNKETNQFILKVESSDVIKDDEGKEVGTQKALTEQLWSKEGIESLVQQVKKQKEQIDKALETTKTQLKAIPKFSKRERDTLITFRRNMERVQQMQKADQLEGQRLLKKVCLKQLQKI